MKRLTRMKVTGGKVISVFKDPSILHEDETSIGSIKRGEIVFADTENISYDWHGNRYLYVESEYGPFGYIIEKALKEVSK